MKFSLYSRWLAIVALILISGYLVSTKIKSTAPTKSASPEHVIKSTLPESWIISVEENVVPTLWHGDAKCKLFKLNNPSEKYFEPNGGFDYTAWHNFWFCPKNWVAEAPEILPMVQEYPAVLLCDCKDFKIFHLSLGENSLKNLPQKIKMEFSK